MVKSYRNLEVWQSGMDLATECYRLAKVLPKSEEFRLTSQLLRASASVPANLAEGWSRATHKEFARYVGIARGSLAEVETFLLLSIRTGLVPERETDRAMKLTDKLGRQLNALRSQIARTEPTSDR
jgi:four helix bundle protein